MRSGVDTSEPAHSLTQVNAEFADRPSPVSVEDRLELPHDRRHRLWKGCRGNENLNWLHRARLGSPVCRSTALGSELLTTPVLGVGT